MAKLIDFAPTVNKTIKTYATKANAVKAVEAKFPGDDLRYLMMVADDGRFYPVFLGEAAIQAGVHFHFCVAN